MSPAAIKDRLSRLDSQAAVLSARISDGEDSASLWRECEQVTEEFDALLEALSHSR